MKSFFFQKLFLYLYSQQIFCPSMNCVYIKVSILTAVFMEIKTSEFNLEGPLFALKEKSGQLS